MINENIKNSAAAKIIENSKNSSHENLTELLKYLDIRREDLENVVKLVKRELNLNFVTTEQFDIYINTLDRDEHFVSILPDILFEDCEIYYTLEEYENDNSVNVYCDANNKRYLITGEEL